MPDPCIRQQVYEPCEIGCESVCDINCQTTCETSCQTGCQTLCDSSCIQGCQSFCDACDSCQHDEGCNSCNSCQNGCNWCNWCNNCNSGGQSSDCDGCNTCQSECQLGKQTPDLCNQNFFVNINTPNQSDKISLTQHWQPIFNAVEAIKNKYSNYTNGIKPFSSYTKPSFTAGSSTIPASMVNNIISSSVVQNQTTISANNFSILLTNIKNYNLDIELCNDCNTGCNVATCETLQCDTCNSCDASCQGCNSCNSCNSGCLICNACGDMRCNLCVSLTNVA